MVRDLHSEHMNTKAIQQHKSKMNKVLIGTNQHVKTKCSVGKCITKECKNALHFKCKNFIFQNLVFFMTYVIEKISLLVTGRK